MSDEGCTCGGGERQALRTPLLPQLPEQHQLIRWTITASWEGRCVSSMTAQWVELQLQSCRDPRVCGCYNACSLQWAGTIFPSLTLAKKAKQLVKKIFFIKETLNVDLGREQCCYVPMWNHLLQQNGAFGGAQLLAPACDPSSAY